MLEVMWNKYKNTLINSQNINNLEHLVIAIIEIYSSSISYAKEQDQNIYLNIKYGASRKLEKSWIKFLLLRIKPFMSRMLIELVL